MGKKEVFTRIDAELYKKIKERGYKIVTLIEEGFKVLEGKNEKSLSEKIDELIIKINKLEEKINEVSGLPSDIKSDLSKLVEFVGSSKKRIGERIFPSKADMLDILNTIESHLKKVIKRFP